MGILLFSNFAQSTLASGISDTDSTLSVSTGDGTLFPNPAFSGDYFICILQKSDGTYEYVYCTDRSTDTMTIERGKEGTSAKSFNSGDLIMNALTKEGIRTIMNQIWFREEDALTYVDGSNFKLPGDKTDIYVANRALKLYQDTDANGWVSSSSYDGGTDETTVTVQDCTVDSGLSGGDFGQEPLSDPKYTTNADTVDSEHASDLASAVGGSGSRQAQDADTVDSKHATAFCHRADNLANLADKAAAIDNMGALDASENLNDLGSASTARSNLGLGSAATESDTRYAHRSNNLSDLGSASTARGNLNLGTAATSNDSDFAASGHDHDARYLNEASNLSDVDSASTSRSNLGLGSAATQSDTRYNHRSNNLSDVNNASTSRSNLGLGSAAVESDTRYNHRGNNLGDVSSVASARGNLSVAGYEVVLEGMYNAPNDDINFIDLGYSCEGIYEFFSIAAYGETGDSGVCDIGGTGDIGATMYIAAMKNDMGGAYTVPNPGNYHLAIDHLGKGFTSDVYVKVIRWIL